ncbi:sulfide:quinone oxidoreductase [Thermoflavifilum aggregans]|uniref:Sulfide:quinone oxidoreductase n=1 Tax=Thermoflavifilum aggregans TaxID=454188 RepID=A0A2M9CUQ1_9BACT|nr:FAD/NAD(P)-binding oxidoreductase [Thermoflavifilum aggregans]PJJ75654.1 sulfide:quinone oxidoreductase [Thermoflavifilum aggregans]
MKNHYAILIVGGGNAGISVAAKLLLKRKLEIAIIEPSTIHYYQPAWTLVGGGAFDIRKTVRPEQAVMPPGVTWIQDRVTEFFPENHQVKTASGDIFGYDYLIVAPGIQLDWDRVEGLKETIGKHGVCSNYAYDYAPYTYACLQQIRPGQTALFTSPSTPVKCGGAPQKIMYLAADYFRRKGILDQVQVAFYSGGTKIFGVPKYAEALQKLVDRYHIQLHFYHDLIRIDGENQIATFLVRESNGQTHEVQVPFHMIHVVPPQSAPDFIKQSPLADAQGWVDVDPYTLQHVRYPDIFGIGDATNTPNAKTGAAVRKQAPVLVENLLALMDGKPMPARYNGYSSCPIVAGYGKLILAEFDYNNQPMETFPFNQAKPRWSMWILKKYILPWLYWHKILKGTI